MICLILLMILSCQSTSYYEVAGIKNELFSRKEGTVNNDFINHRDIDRIINNLFKTKKEKEGISVDRNGRGTMAGESDEHVSVWEVGGNNSNKKEVSNMGESEIITMITSIIAGLYAIVKTIINLIKKIKK